MSSIVNKTIDKIFDYAITNEVDSIFLQQKLDNNQKITNEWLVSYRLCGKQTSFFILQSEISKQIIEQLKKLANINNRKRDGSFKLNNYHHPIQCDLTVIKTESGEKIIINLKVKPALAYHIDSLGMSGEQLSLLNKAVIKKQGVIVLTGASCSGKTSTAYSIMQALNSPNINVSSIEYPIKTRINSINQVLLNPCLDVNQILRELKKQDTDIIYLNHLSDKIDLQILSNIANDKLVIISQSSNSIIEFIHLLLNIKNGIDLISNLNLIINQSLAKSLCQNCSVSHKLDYYALEDLHDQFDLNDTKLLRRADFYHGKGCNYCEYSGYNGETSLFEFLPIDKEIINSLKHRRLSIVSKRLIQNKLHLSLLEDAFIKALQGKIPITEIQRLF